MTQTRRFPRITTAAALLAAASTLGACDKPLDFDLRGKIGGRVDTSDAALSATTRRPRADDRGVISYPNYQVAVAQRGDSVADVAKRVGLPAAELARYNGVKVDDPLRKGEIMALPRRVSEPSPATGASTAGPIKPPAQVDVATLAGSAIDRASATPARSTSAAAGVEPVRHQVERGETAFTIARLYQVSPRALAEWNSLDKDFSVREGQFLLIPVVEDKPKTAPVAAPSVTEPGAGSVSPVPPSASKPLPNVTPPAAAAPKPTPAVATKPAAPEKPVADIGQSSTRQSGAMQMPVNGRIIREYAKGRNEGIDIAANAGAPVKAAASGKVASISTTAEGVKFLLIRHPDDVITVYTHLDDITVAKGDAVSRGQSVGRVRSGDPAFLHFEVRKGFESTDPMSYLQ